jgi:hypothetical protein
MDKAQVVSSSHNKEESKVTGQISQSVTISSVGRIRAHVLLAIRMHQEANKNRVNLVIRMRREMSKGKGRRATRMHQEVIKDHGSHVIQMHHEVSNNPVNPDHRAIRMRQEEIKDLVNQGHPVTRMPLQESSNLRVSHVIRMHLSMKTDLTSKVADKDATGTETVTVTGGLVLKAESDLHKIILQNDI